jgi:hypothetical protein
MGEKASAPSATGVTEPFSLTPTLPRWGRESLDERESWCDSGA